MKIISWNVNGLRAARKKGFTEYVAKENPDIICIQEAKAPKEVLKEADHLIEGYDLYWAQAKKAGYSGVAIWVRTNLPVIKCEEFLGHDEYDNEGRTIIVELENFFLINSYYPNGRPDLSRVDFKLDYSYKILDLAKKLGVTKPVILTGDFNTAHFEIDLARPKENENTTGFLLKERKFLDDLSNEGFVDAFRIKYPDKKDIYSWWSYRTGAKFRNVGWRIDYFWVSKILSDKIKDIHYNPAENASDHCPVVLELL